MIRPKILAVSTMLVVVDLWVSSTAVAQITDKTYQGPTGPPLNVWSNPFNWFPFDGNLPGATNNVIHNTGGQVRYDVTIPGNQTIFSMEVDGGAGAELTVEAALELNILRYLERDLFSPPYLLHIESSGQMNVGSGNPGDGLFDIDGLLDAGTTQAPTMLSVDGDIEYGQWFIDSDVELVVNGEILRGKWDVLGGTIEAHAIDASGGVLGDGGEWAVGGTVLPLTVISGVWGIYGGTIGAEADPVQSISGGAWELFDEAMVYFSDTIDANPWAGIEGGAWTLHSGSAVQGEIGSTIVGGDWLVDGGNVFVEQITQADRWQVENDANVESVESISGGPWTISNLTGAADEPCVSSLAWTVDSLSLDQAKVNCGEYRNATLLLQGPDAGIVAANCGENIVRFQQVTSLQEAPYSIRMNGGGTNHLTLWCFVSLLYGSSSIEYDGFGNVFDNHGRILFGPSAFLGRGPIGEGELELRVTQLEIQTALASSESWDATGAILHTVPTFLAGTPCVEGFGTVETLNTDWGPVWFCDVGPLGEIGPDPRIKPWAAVVVDNDTRLVDDFTNDNHGLCTRGCLYPAEAVFVLGDVNVGAAATLDTNNLHVYLLGQLTNNGTITDPDAVVEIVQRHYGDFDADGDIDKADVKTLVDATGDPTTNVLCDADLDGDVDDDDVDRFNQNMALYGNNTVCRGVAAVASIAVPTPTEIEGIVQWANALLSPADQQAMSESIEMLIDGDPTRPDAEKMLDLADALREQALR